MVLLLVRQLLQLLQTLLLLMLYNALYAAIPVEVLDAEDMAIYMGRDYFRATNCITQLSLSHGPINNPY
jgi:hypothetical protein